MIGNRWAHCDAGLPDRDADDRLDFARGQRGRDARGFRLGGAEPSHARVRADARHRRLVVHGRPTLAGSMPFPLWLYGRSDLDYVRGIRLRTPEHALMRVQYLAGRRKRPPARPDGYSNCEGAYQRVNYGAGAGSCPGPQAQGTAR